MEQHSFWRFLGNHRPLNHCIHVFVFGLKAKKAGSVVPPALLQVGCLSVFSSAPDPGDPPDSIHTARVNS
jgi:hypothetical protein